jgi:O-antigen/teichoic acid export membrane protein
MDYQESPMLASEDVVERDFEGLEPSKTIEATPVVDSGNTRLLADVSWLRRIFSAATTGGLAVLGQGLFAGSHFVVNILLARWLPAEQYGAFALAYACFLLFSMLYNACVYEPVIVFGSGKYAATFDGYVRILMRANALTLAAVGVVMLSVSLVLGRLYSPAVQYAFASLALAAPFILTASLGRAGFYARLQPGRAAVGGAFYFFALLGALVALQISNRLSPVTAFLAMGLAGLAANLFLLLHMGLRWNQGSNTLTFFSVLEDHWRYGRWAMASVAVTWFSDNIYYAVLSMRSGLDASAALRALVNFANPLGHVLIGLSAILTPTLVRNRRQGGWRSMRRTILLVLSLLTPVSALYLLALWLGRSDLFRLLYAGKYQAYSGWPFLLVGLLPVIQCATVVLGAGLRAVERPDIIFWSLVVASMTTLVCGVPLALHRGVVGAAGGLLISNLAAALGLLWFCRHAVGPDCAISETI